ncbi:CRISPR-associated protein Csd1 [Pelomonas aquatica]|uniref:CRISPR-associated protein Csd1 n=1 Tax=Pelomonas aquatica TaxID=431058 RepID=A0ABU1ZC81_9BURK|nr:type I-C CRISPR-associated protein Cas8c/Csd1 [Pelomonas aquatica]MDR7298058.1 CRISPR-associated protein Csd1 [Pelomonas aquatica]
MILHALADLYERRSHDPDPARRLPRPGWEDKVIPFVVELRPDGSAVQLRDTRRQEGKKRVGASFLVPQSVKKTSGVAANLLWDSAEYALGASAKAESPNLAKQAAAFRERAEALLPWAGSDVGLNALLAFLRAPHLTPLQAAPHWAEMLETNAQVAFELQGDPGLLICERPAVAAAIDALRTSQSAGELAPCLILQGQQLPAARLHTSIKGVWGAQSSGANVVSFNLDAFNSYGKTQGLNAPVSAQAAFAYTTALNDLLKPDSRNRVQVGDASTVFWADRPHEFDGEYTLADLLGEPKPDNPDRGRDAVRALYRTVQAGQQPAAEGSTRFFILGLAPNAARISVRFWLPGVPFAELAPRLLQHFEDIRVARRFDNEPETPSLFRLLTSCALQGKADNIPPRLAGEWMRAILEDLPLPAGLLNAAVQRCKAEQDVTYLRACVLKAWLNRQMRSQPRPNLSTLPFKETLDMSNDTPAYKCGRLFATFERIQGEAQGDINTTIRDRYFGAASTTPANIFASLQKLMFAHLRKLTKKRAEYFQKLVGEIVALPMRELPHRLTLPQQAEFALGYYHQRQDFFTKKTDTDTTTDQPQGD